MMQLLALLPAAIGVAPCTTCRGPVWSWATPPVFFHGSDAQGGDGDGGFTAAQLATIGRFPMATLEKWQGQNAPARPSTGQPLTEEEAWVVAARQLKAQRPNQAVVVWFDSYRIYCHDKALNPDWKGGCADGNFAPAAFLESGGRMDGKLDPTSVYLLKNRSGLPAIEDFGHCHVFDHTKAVARNYWRDMCLNMTASGVIDGCGADASWQGADQAAHWGLDATQAAAWDAGHKQMMRATTAALGDGLLLGKDPWEVGDYVNGALHEGCAASNDTVNTLRNLTALSRAQQGRRLLYQCHGNGGSGFRDEFAAFLAGVGEYQYYGLGGWVQQTGGDFGAHWVAGAFDRPLGAPLSDAEYDGVSGNWTRRFASGTAVTFNAKTNRGDIQWGAPPAPTPPPPPLPPTPAPAPLPPSALAGNFSAAGGVLAVVVDRHGGAVTATQVQPIRSSCWHVATGTVAAGGRTLTLNATGKACGPSGRLFAQGNVTGTPPLLQVEWECFKLPDMTHCAWPTWKSMAA